MERKTKITLAESFGIYGIASVSPEVEVANPRFNIQAILRELKRKEIQNSQFVVFPELSLTGYTCGDLFYQSSLISEAIDSLSVLADKLKYDSRLITVGLPVLKDGQLYNCAAIICGGEILGFVPKIHIPNYQEFYEKRWFSSGYGIVKDSVRIGNIEIPFGTGLLFERDGVKVGIEICEDLWVPSPPSSDLCKTGAEIILNLSATDDNIGKYDYIKSLVASQSGRCRCVYAYASAGKGESSTDLVFSGINLVAVDGSIVAESSRFNGDDSYTSALADIEKIRQDRRKYSSFYSSNCHKRNEDISLVSCPKVVSDKDSLEEPRFSVSPHPFVPGDKTKRQENCNEIINIQSWGLAQRLKATGCRKIVVGISGGLDSTLALLVAHYTFSKLGYDPKGILGVTMPATATSDRTHDNALKLMEILGVTSFEIPVNDAVFQHFKDIGHNPEEFNAVYENSYARERTQILMDLANKHGGLVLGTGDMSELALGWCTYNGDHMSMYNVNSGVPKTLVKFLVKWYADMSDSAELKKVLDDVVETPISPELIPADSKKEIHQRTEDLIGPYELHDFFLYHVVRNGFSPRKIMYLAEKAFPEKYSRETIKKWLINFYRRFFSQQFKRSCMPDGPKIGSVCLSPRGDWRMPSDAKVMIWIKEAEGI